MTFLGRRPPAVGLMTLSGGIDDACAQTVFAGLRRLLDSGRPVSGLLLRLASQGGSLAAAQAVVELLQQFREETGAIVVTVVDDQALSAAFHVALAGDRLFAQPAAVLGSLGTALQRFDLSGLANRLGVQDVSVASSPGKRAQGSLVCSPLSLLPSAGLALVDDLQAQFVEWALARRQLPVLPAVALDACTFSGRQALQAGLIDELGGTPRGLAYLVQAKSLRRFELVSLSSASGNWLAALLGGLPLGGWLARWMMSR